MTNLVRTVGLDGAAGEGGVRMGFRVVVVDDHEMVRRGVTQLIEAEDDLAVVGQAETAAAAVDLIAGTAPDVAILDVRLPDGNGIEVCREVRARDPRIACVMLTSFNRDTALSDAVLAGAAGYLLKSAPGATLVDAVRRAAQGESLLDPAETDRVLERLRSGQGEDPRLARLTRQERRILTLITDGLSNRQIADELSLAEKTVKNYVSSLLGKLGVHRRTQAAVFYSRHRQERATETEAQGVHRPAMP
jgi:two-component system, NarL family, response regulator DevR